MCMFRDRVEHQVLISPFLFFYPCMPIINTVLFSLLFILGKVIKLYFDISFNQCHLSQSILTEEHGIVCSSVTLNEFRNRLRFATSAKSQGKN